MREVQTGVWHWQALHPDWEPGADWPQEVSSYAVRDGDRLLVFDPLAPPDELVELAGGLETAIVLTCPWHVRDAVALAERTGAPIHVPPPDADDANPVSGEVFAAGETLPIGVEARPGMEPNDLVLWVPGRRALITGDTLIDRGTGLEFPVEWADKGVPAEEILATLQPLLTLPVELVLPTHGQPAGRVALQRALD